MNKCKKNAGWKIPLFLGHLLFVLTLFTFFMSVIFLNNEASALRKDLYQQAEEFAQKGDLDAMEQAYHQLLQNNPEDIRAKLGRATARSWKGKFNEAQEDFLRILAIDPNHLGALIGLGYNHAWQDRFQEAEQIFKKAVGIAPDNPGGAKGLGYTYLWSGRHSDAVKAFSRFAKEKPNDPEPLVALGQATLSMGHTQEAAKYFNKALTIDPARTDALQGLRSVYNFPALLELQIWGGNTSGGGDAGLRQVELASWPTPRLRLWTRFDDSLSLDNPALARSGQSAKTYYFGAFHQFSENWMGTAEFGFRDLPLGADQQIYRLEGVYLWDGKSIKLSGQLSPHSDDFTDELIYAAYGFSVGDLLRIEPTIYYSTSGGTNDEEIRGVLFANYLLPNGWSLSAGAGGGHIDSAIPGASGSVKIVNGQLTVPVAGFQSLHFSVRYENTPTNEFTVAMIGISLRFPRK